MPPSVKPKMFIASASCEDSSPSRSHSPPVNTPPGDIGQRSVRGCCIADGMLSAPSPVSPKIRSGFSVCDILMEQRSTTLKTVPLIVVSGHSRPNNKPRSPDFLPIKACDDNQRSPCSNSDYSLSPSSSSSLNNARLTEKTSPGQHDISRRLKFGVDRILADDNRVPTIPNSHNTTGEICGPSCTCADDISQMPSFINSRTSYRTHFEYPSSHPPIGCDVNRHSVTAYYPSNVLPNPYAPTPWTIPSHYAHHHHHHLLHPITSAVYPVAHMGSGSALIDPTRGYHYQSHGLSLVGNASVGGAGSAVSAASSAAGVTASVGGKRKRSWSRAVFSNLQRKGLEKRFQIQKYITKPDRRQLAATLGLTDAQVKVWFQNRRMKWRHSKEAKEELAKQSSVAAKVNEPDCRKTERTSANCATEPDKPVELCLKHSEQST